MEINNVTSGMSSGEARELSSGVGDNGEDSDKRGVGSIWVGRWDVYVREDKEEEIGIGDRDGDRGGVDEK